MGYDDPCIGAVGSHRLNEVDMFHAPLHTPAKGSSLDTPRLTVVNPPPYDAFYGYELSVVVKQHFSRRLFTYDKKMENCVCV